MECYQDPKQQHIGVDILKLASEGKVPSCLGNNANAPYAIITLPPAPNQDPSEGQEPPIGYDPYNPNNYPANISPILPGATFKLRPDEAIVLIGQTPPPAYYFSFRSYAGYESYTCYTLLRRVTPELHPYDEVYLL